MINSNKKIIFCPGLGEKPSQYKAFSKIVKVLDVDWNKYPIPKNKYIETFIGFSMGAVVACEYALKKKVKNLILCSLTPGLETLKNIKAEKVIFLVGEKEFWTHKNTKRLAKTLDKKITRKIIVVPGCDHDLSGDYMKTLRRLLKKNGT